MRIVSVGEVLWDVFGETEYLGGAPLNFSVNLQRLGNSAILLTAVGSDPRGIRAIEQMRALGLTTDFVQTVPELHTGAATVITDSSGDASFIIERPAAFDRVHANGDIIERLNTFRPDWIYFGTLAQTDDHNEELLLQLIRNCGIVNRFYDMNLRTGHWELALVQRLSRIATVLKLNEKEAELLWQLTAGNKRFSLAEFCLNWSSDYGVKTICVTLGSKGCAVLMDGSLHTFPGCSIQVSDTVGAGDAFAAAFLHGFHLGWSVERVAPFANALGAFVASRPGATPIWNLDDVELTASGAGTTTI